MEKELIAHRQPSLYLSHGGGPCFWIEFPPPIGAHAFDKLRAFLANLLNTLPQRPSAILIISAHWEEAVPTLGTSPAPGMIFDYYGFPDHTYALNYPAPGAPDIALRAQELLKAANIHAATDENRGFDHGVFVPLLIVETSAIIPVATLSLKHNLDAREHVAIGKALEALRDENILIIGSGNSYHNLRQFFDGSAQASKAFDAWLDECVTDPDIQRRNDRLIDWETAPYARECHPREEHLLPLMVAVGAAGKDKGMRIFNDSIGGKSISCFAFG